MATFGMPQGTPDQAQDDDDDEEEEEIIDEVTEE